MNKLPLTLLTVACSFALTACYSSGGGGGSVQPPKVTDKAPDVATPPAASNNTSSNSGSQNGNSKFFTTVNSAFETKPSTEISGTILTVAQNGDFTAKKPETFEDLDSIMVDGVKITLFTAGDKLSNVAVGKLKQSTENGGKLYVGSMADSYGTYGSYQDPNSFKAMRYGAYTLNGQTHLFVQGFLTPTQSTINVLGDTFYPMPKESTYKYSGFALYGKDNQYAQLNSEVIADFSNKKLKVELKEAGAATAKATFGGEISGNTFSGTRDGIETKGAFYGSLARDVAGLFNDTKTGNNGVFGASDKRAISSSLEAF
ncbi:transferrin-binding protein-like solute binding protein [Actinobacillus equuli subsp. haemolyticus]|uniref:transferrin-binding protein-like solute binding protein n=1 Tax=Actinobacillus equuli TaxID=718 RepID=UPI0024435EEF|nr:transferrin-binding protein-like solute binding protein [Actinobacillus equuli]WGE68789.1 transferrin-binding protein-like solute binding protein [Actinobacillus equuli subsp. haemolyticus]WGE84917.1 transferrin-binding protein-like solute binding protein [Actinobacillus equuli subsp. haemolyticus]